MTTALASFEVALWDAIEAKHTGIHPRMFLIESKTIGKNAAKCAIVLLPTVYVQGNPRTRPGARWIVYVSDRALWTNEAQQLMVTQVANEVAEYIKKGTIHANVPNPVELEPASLQRSTDRTIN